MAEYGQIRGRKSAQVDQMSVLAFVYWRVINALTLEVAARTETKRWLQERHFEGQRNETPNLLVHGGKEESSKIWNQVTRRIFYEQPWGHYHGG